MKYKIIVLQPLWLSAEERTVMPSEEPIEVEWAPETLDLIVQAKACELVVESPPPGPKSKGPVQPEVKE